MKAKPGAGRERGMRPRLVAVLAAWLVAAGAVAPAADAMTRIAVPGGSGSSSTCLSASDACSLKHVLETVVVSNDEVVVLPGTHDVGSMGARLKNNVTGLSVHGQDGQARPRVTSTGSGPT